MSKFTNQIEFIKNNQRYFWALFIIFFIFLISKNFFINYTVTSEDCQGGKCMKNEESASLSDKDTIYFINDVINSSLGEYCRLVFEVKATEKSNISIALSKATDERKIIKNLDIGKSDDYQYKEITFPVDGKYSDLVFTKKRSKDSSKIFLRNINLSKLNISNEAEFLKLKPTLIGRVNIDVPEEKQFNSDKKFSQLQNENTLLGQVFRAQGDYISGVTFDIDVTKIDNRGGKKYVLDLREAEFDGEIYTVSKKSLASLDFTVNNIEKYRQNDGKIRFPVFSFLEKGNYYFIGIDNGRVKTDQFNYLTLRGSADDKYKDGTAVVKKSGDTLRVNGDLYFIIYGAEFSRFNGERILNGAIIEDIGKGKGIFIYKTSGAFSDFIDLDSVSQDIKFNNNDNIITGLSNQTESHYTYKFNTIYPIKTINIKAKQAGFDLNRVNIYYSFNQQNWEEMPFIMENGIQKFDYSVENITAKNEIYVKITPMSEDLIKEDTYGISDLEVTGDLIIK